MVLESRSPSLQYQVSLLEQAAKAGGSSRPSLSKTEICFSILNEIIPYTGVYKEVITMVLDTLRQAIFSTTLTSNEGQSSEANYLPYFEMVFRLEEEKNAAAAVLKDESEQLRSEVDKRSRESENIATVLAEKTVIIKMLESQIGKKKVTLVEKDKMISARESEIQVLAIKIEEQKDVIEKNKVIHEAELKKVGKDIDKLSQYKKDYHKMQKDLFTNYELDNIEEREEKENKETEENKDDEEENRDEEKRDEEKAVTEEGDMTDITSVVKIEEKALPKAPPPHVTKALSKGQEISEGAVIHKQLLSLLNSLISEKELFTDKYNVLVLGGLKRDKLSNWHKRYIMLRENFYNSASEVLNEVGLLTSHNSYISEREQLRLGELDSEKEGDVSVKELFGEGKDPFNSKERITAKYSAKVEISSNECRTFSLLAGSSFCVSCDESVFICPHKQTKASQIIKLPKGATHIRVERPLKIPKLKMGLSLAEPVLDADDPETQELKKKLAPMWRRTNMTPDHISRDLSREYVMQTIQHFYLYMINLEKSVEVIEHKSFLDHFLDFSLAQYQLEEVVQIVMVDILSHVSKYAHDTPFIAIFGLILAQELDPTVFKYVYLLNEVLLGLDLVCPLDIRPILMVLYPFLTDEDIDPHVLTYVSFSNNRISPYHISQYLMHCVIRSKEPRIGEANNRLLRSRAGEALSKMLQNPGSRPDTMNSVEFSISIEVVFPLATNRTKDLYFSQCIENVRKDSKQTAVPIEILAQGLAHMQLVHSMSSLTHDINEKVVHYRNKIPAAMVEAGLKQKLLPVDSIPSYDMAKKQLVEINKAAKSLELLNNNPCWRQDVDLASEYLDLTRLDSGV